MQPGHTYKVGKNTHKLKRMLHLLIIGYEDLLYTFIQVGIGWGVKKGLGFF